MSLLSKQTIGIDISDRSIEVVCVEKKGRGFSIVSSARAELPVGLVTDGTIKNETELAKLLLVVFAKAGIAKQESRLAMFGIPARFTYLRTIEAPKEKANYKEAVDEDLSRSVPLAESNRLVSFKSVLDEAKKNWLFVFAADKAAVVEWNRFLTKCGLKNVQFTIELLATGVGLKDQVKNNPFCLLDLGADTTKIGFFIKNNLRSAAVNNLGGDDITYAVAEACAKDVAEAEKEKCAYGLSSRSNVSVVIRSYIDHLAVVIAEEIKFAEGILKTVFKQVVVVGGTAELKGLSEYLSEKLGRVVTRGEARAVLKGGESFFIEAFGLGVIGLAPDDYMLISSPASKELASPKIVERPKQSAFTNLSINDNDAKTFSDDPLLRRRLFLLIALAVLSLIALGVSMWYRSVQEKNQAAFIAAQPRFTEVTPVDMFVPVAINKAEQTADRAVGSLLYISLTAGSQEEAINFSRIQAEKNLVKGEKLWTSPISVSSTGKVFGVSNSGNVNKQTPFIVVWLSYNDAQVNSLLINKAGTILLPQKISYGVNNIQKIGVAPGENPSVYNLSARITLATMEKIPDAVVQNFRK